MARKKTPEDALYKKLQTLEPDKWFKCPPGEEGEVFIATIKKFIDIGMPENFELSEDYKKVRRCYRGCRCPFDGSMLPLPAGFTAELHNPTRTFPPFTGLNPITYDIKYKGKLFTQETYFEK